jgi:hypothetical protein
MQLDSAFLTASFTHGCLASSPVAAILADPFACGSRREPEQGVSFRFSDIPTIDFREPPAILKLSYTAFRRN